MFFIPRRIAFILLATLVSAGSAVRAYSGPPATPSVVSVRFWSFGDVTRVAIETSGDYSLYSEQIEKPNRVYFDLTGLRAPAAAGRAMQVIPVGDPRIRQIRVARLSGSKTRIVLDLDSSVEVASSQLVNPDRLMIEVRPHGTSLPALLASRPDGASHKVDVALKPGAVDSDIAGAPSPLVRKIAKGTRPSRDNPPAKDDPVKDDPSSKDDPSDAYHPKHDVGSEISEKPQPPAVAPIIVPAQLGTLPAPALPSAPAGPDRSLVRVFGLKMGRVVIDAGHGGHDSGTVGPNGLMEKNLVLDVALRLGAMISRQMGAEVVYTRSSDVFIPLEQRTKIANDQKADLFISVHANSSPEPTASGVETYYFNLTSDRGGLDLATRENATANSAISDLGDLLHRAVLQTKREESREFAQRVQASLSTASLKMSDRVKDRGVRQAPFVVLIGATMPSILAEIGFVSNPRDEKMMRRPEQRQKIADALFKGVAQYASSLNHMQMARASAK